MGEVFLCGGIPKVFQRGGIPKEFRGEVRKAAPGAFEMFSKFRHALAEIPLPV